VGSKATTASANPGSSNSSYSSASDLHDNDKDIDAKLPDGTVITSTHTSQPSDKEY